MTDSDLLIDTLNDLASLYPRYRLEPRTLTLYVQQLSDLPTPLVLRAIDRCGKTLTFFPAVAEIRREAGTLMAKPGQIAEAAWTTVNRMILAVGQYKTPVFEDPVVAQTVESIGWRTLCTMEAVDAQKSFIFTYRNLRERAVSQVQRGDFGPGLTALDLGDAIPLGDAVALPH